MEPTFATRPRNVDWKRAAALLYGDWGTSKAYVPGIAFAIALYSSFWFVLAVTVLTALVGINYIWVCKYFPQGGGVYSAAREHSRHLALVGGFLLVANYLVTASLSCFEGFVYLNYSYFDAQRLATLAIVVIGMVNLFGPRHSGTMAAGLAAATMVVVVILAIACIPQIPQAWANVETPQRSPGNWWIAFTGVILALSGVESIANMTGVMKLDPGSTSSKPRVAVTSRKAIIVVMIEVCVLTALFGLAMMAIPNMGAHEHEGDMLRYMGEVFVDKPMSAMPGLGWFGQQNVFSWIISLVMGGLLLSATNTAIVAMVSVLYLMAKDGELPKPFASLNRFGVPWILMLIAILGCIVVLEAQSGEKVLQGLATLYAIGVVGAIAVNLGSCALNFRLPMLWYERSVMTVTFLVVAAIEITIAINKPVSAVFVGIVLGLGYVARTMHKGLRIQLPKPATDIAEKFFPALAAKRQRIQAAEMDQATIKSQLGPERPVNTIVVAAKGITPTLRYAVEQARVHNAQLVVLYVREIRTTIPVPMSEEDDIDARAVFNAAKSLAEGLDVLTLYAVSDDPAWTILDTTAMTGADVLMMGHSKRTAITRMLHGNLLTQVADLLPEETRLIIVG